MTDIEVLDFLAKELTRDVRVAVALGVSAQTLGNWRNRGSISTKKRLAVWELANRYGAHLSQDWLLRALTQGEAA